MNGRPSCWKISSWPNWNGSIVGYSPCPLPAQVPSIHASGAQRGWMFSGISNGMRRSLLGVGGIYGGVHGALEAAYGVQRERSDPEYGHRDHHDEEGFHGLTLGSTPLSPGVHSPG